MVGVEADCIQGFWTGRRPRASNP